MINMSVKLEQLEAEGKSIKASIVGAGQMGRANHFRLRVGAEPQDSVGALP